MTIDANADKPDYSAAFYTKHADRYAEVAHQYLQSVYIESSHPALTGDLVLQDRLKELVIPKGRGLDAGCGAGARDVYTLWSEGYDMWGVDAVPENIRAAHTWHPEIQERVSVHDLREPLPFEENWFDFATCNAVIQHIDPCRVYDTVLPELVRILKPGGVLQLMFKNGEGTETLYDKDYDAQRCFQLFKEDRILDMLRARDMQLIEAEGKKLGGVMEFVDPKHSRHCVMFLRKNSNQ
jgi:SAM-dependent methyltransferase